MRNFFILILIVLSISCGREPSKSSPDLLIEAQFYLEEAKNLFRDNGIEQKYIDMVDDVDYIWLEGNGVSEDRMTRNIGNCQKSYDTINKKLTLVIHINKDFWYEPHSDIKYGVDNPRMFLILHELGHCIFNLEHDDSKINIMSTVLNNKIFEDMEYYEQEFAGRLK
jgi:hypothetical protein